MSFPVDLFIAVPARNEEERIDACLRSVLAAVRRAREDGLLASVRLGVAAHRCTDDTAARAASALDGADAEVGVELAVDVIEDVSSSTVGEVRHRLIGRLAGDTSAAAHTGAATAGHTGAHTGADIGRAPRTWVLNTDADSVVPADWITGTLAPATAVGAAAVAGLVEVTGWSASSGARSAYRRLVASGLRPDGHDHAYAANLAVRLDAYRAVGGFAHRLHGEDRLLLASLRRHGWIVLTPPGPVVRTSGRMPGRATHGLGARLMQLEQQAAR